MSDTPGLPGLHKEIVFDMNEERPMEMKWDESGFDTHMDRLMSDHNEGKHHPAVRGKFLATCPYCEENWYSLVRRNPSF